MCNSLLLDFFYRKYEQMINNQMLFYDCIFPEMAVKSYVNELLSVPLEKFFNYIQTDLRPIGITSNDVFQFSDLEVGTWGVCHALKLVNDPGMKHLAVGKLLLNDGKIRTDIAYTKYGENHAKMAESIGLLHSIHSTFFLSCIGYLENILTLNEKKLLIPRLLLRSNMISSLIQKTSNGNISLRDELSFISESTFLRRKSNIKTVFRELLTSQEFNFSNFVSKIKLD